MYPAVCGWLQRFLQGRHRKAEVSVYDASQKSLVRLIEERSLYHKLPTEWHSWDIHVDIVGFIKTKATTTLAFVECKNEAIKLQHLSQILGYSRVARPAYSIIIAPQGPAGMVTSLLKTYGRLDVLHYHWRKGKLPRSVTVGRWDEAAGCLDLHDLIIGDENVWR